MKRILHLSVVLALGLVMGSCGGSSTLNDTEASVVLTMDVTAYNPEIDICLQQTDLTIENMSITSTAKAPGTNTSTNQDVNLTRWVITPYRTDGGSTASPEWTYDQAVFVPAGGSAALSHAARGRHHFADRQIHWRIGGQFLPMVGLRKLPEDHFA